LGYTTSRVAASVFWTERDKPSFSVQPNESETAHANAAATAQSRFAFMMASKPG
jgi:hypothetical protein